MLLPPTLVFEVAEPVEVAPAEVAEPVEIISAASIAGAVTNSTATPSGNNDGTPSMEIQYTKDGRPLVTPAFLASLDGWRQDPLIASALYKLYQFVEYEQRDGSHVVKENAEAQTGGTVGEEASEQSAQPADTNATQGIERSPRFYLYGDAPSSLDVAHDLARQGKLEPWDAVMVTSQSAGRGQLRREWSSPCGNLYAAWRLPLEFPFTEGYAALVVGSMLAEALSTIRIPIKLKWPNDILLKGKKVGGILLEQRGDVLLAGIGINVFSAPPEELLREDHAIAATSLLGEGFQFATPLTLFCSLVNMGRFWYRNQVQNAQGAQFPQCMEKYLAWRHQNIVVHGGNSDIKNGTIMGIAPCGGLTIVQNGVEKVLDSGSIVLEY